MSRGAPRQNPKAQRRVGCGAGKFGNGVKRNPSSRAELTMGQVGRRLGGGIGLRVRLKIA